MSVIRCNTNKLAKDHSDTANQIAMMKNDVADIKSRLAQLDAVWDGEASEAYKECLNSKLAELDELIACLEQMNVYQSSARDDYNKNEHEIEVLIDTIQ